MLLSNYYSFTVYRRYENWFVEATRESLINIKCVLSRIISEVQYVFENSIRGFTLNELENEFRAYKISIELNHKVFVSAMRENDAERVCDMYHWIINWMVSSLLRYETRWNILILWHSDNIMKKRNMKILRLSFYMPFSAFLFSALIQ